MRLAAEFQQAQPARRIQRQHLAQGAWIDMADEAHGVDIIEISQIHDSALYIVIAAKAAIPRRLQRPWIAAFAAMTKQVGVMKNAQR
jgi:hypothetical protein